MQDVLGIPEGLDDFYTQPLRQQMHESGFTYQEVEALLDLGYLPQEMFLLTPEQKDVYVTAGRFRPHDSGPEELTNLLYGYIEGLDDYFANQPSALQTVVPQLVQYGTSELGRPLYYWRISNSQGPPKNRIMLTFAVHGYEGEVSCDGAHLVEQACQIAFFYCKNPKYLHNTELIVVPMVNPDGVMNPNGNAGFGRGQSRGIDINRDFLAGKFQAAESLALKTAVDRLSPDILIDFHGWYDETYGDPALAQVFAKHMDLPHADAGYGTRQGYLYGYAKSQGSRALLVEHNGLRVLNTSAILFSLNEIINLQSQQTS